MTPCVDTGVFLAAADVNDNDHAACARVLDSYEGPLFTTPLVMAEAGWLIERQVGPVIEAAFYRSAADSEFIVEPLTPEDWRRIAELTEVYADNGLGGVDASVVAVAERIGITTVATLDQRHFRVVRPRHVDAFTLVP